MSVSTLSSKRAVPSRRPLRTARSLMAIVAVGLLTAACDFHDPVGPGTLVSIEVVPDVTLPINGTQQFVAIGRDADGRELEFSPTWSVVNGGGAINGTGFFTAGTTPGAYDETVQASSGGVSGTATVTVVVGPLASITVTPDPDTLAINGTRQFTAVGRDAGGNILEITPTWSVVAGGGDIDGAGTFTAGTAPGTFGNTVRATSGELAGHATVVVTPGPLASLTVTPDPVALPIDGTQQFTAVGRDSAGNIVSISPVWSVENGGGTINATGLFTAGDSPGTYDNTVQATSGGLSDNATVTVTAGALASITVAPDPTTLPINGNQQFTAVGRDTGGNIVPISPVWSVTNGGGSISASGMFTAGANTGTFANTVRATSGSVSGNATVTVIAGGLASITVTPDPAALAPNGVQQFVAVGRDGSGNVIPISPVWSVVAGGGTIDSGSGVFTAGTTLGTFNNTVRATLGGVSGDATVVVSAGIPASITVVPNPATMQVGDTEQFTAVGRDANGNIVPISPTWSVVNPGAGSIDANGLFTAGGTAGTFNDAVRASSAGVEGFATVIVQAAASAPFLDLGPNGIIAGTTVTCVSGGLILADISIHPGMALVGFGPCVYTGQAHLGTPPAAEAQANLTTAYNTLAGLPCGTVIAADLGGTTLLPGVYCSASSIGVTGTVTLDGNGDPDAVFVFQAGSTLTTAGNVALINGAQAKNVYWQVGSSATLGTASQWQGNILSLESITLNANVTLLGRALARNGAVTLDSNNTITLP